MAFRFRRGALDDIARSRGVLRALDDAAEDIRDRARKSARSVSPDLVDGIVAEPAETTLAGPEARVGYEKSHPGFVLFFHEVGTQNHAPTPHLRRAMRGRSTS